MEQRRDVETGSLSDSVPFVSQVLSFSFPCVLHCLQKMSLIICPVGQRLWRPELHVSSFVRGTQPGLDMEFVTAESEDASAGHEVMSALFYRCLELCSLSPCFSPSVWCFFFLHTYFSGKVVFFFIVPWQITDTKRRQASSRASGNGQCSRGENLVAPGAVHLSLGLQSRHRVVAHKVIPNNTS